MMIITGFMAPFTQPLYLFKDISVMAPINLERGFLNVWNTNPSGDNISDCLLLLLKYFLNKSRLPYHDFKPSTEYVSLAGVWHVTLPLGSWLTSHYFQLVSGLVIYTHWEDKICLQKHRLNSQLKWGIQSTASLQLWKCALERSRSILHLIDWWQNF